MKLSKPFQCSGNFILGGCRYSNIIQFTNSLKFTFIRLVHSKTLPHASYALVFIISQEVLDPCHSKYFFSFSL